VVRFVVTSDSVRPVESFPWPAAISPDGSMMVYSAPAGGGTMLYSQRTDQLEGRPIPGTQDAFQAFFSPDGQWLAFETLNAEKKVRLDGSSPVKIADGGGSNGADWLVSDTLFVGATGSTGGLSKVSVAGGRLAAFTRPDTSNGERQHVWPIGLPDGKGVVFTIWRGALASSQLAVASLDGSVKSLGVEGIRPLALLDDHVVYVQADGALMAVPFDVRGKVLTGSPVPVHDPVPVFAPTNGNSSVFISRGGALLSARGSGVGRLTWVTRDGTTRDALPSARPYFTPSISRDGKYIAVGIGDQRGGDVWVYDIQVGTLTRATSSGTVTSVRWSADGDLIYTAGGDRTRSAVWRLEANSGRPAQRLFESQEFMPATTISPDGRSLLNSVYHQTTWDLNRVPLDSGAVERTYLSTAMNQVGPAFSLDGKWVALSSDESGKFEVYVRSFPDPTSRIQVSIDGGSEPFWSADGSRLFYRAGASLMAARVAFAPAFAVNGRDTVFKVNPFMPYYFQSNPTITPAGDRFLGVIADRNDFQLIVSPNWLTEFRRRIRKD
jgi:serine/threonine-protein kinase